MLTIREAARLLSAPALSESSTFLGSASAFLEPLGFGAPLKLDRAARRDLGLPDASCTACLAAPPGDQRAASGLRALFLQLHASGREPIEAGDRRARHGLVARDAQVGRTAQAAQLARTVARLAPSNLWVLIVRDARAGTVSIAAPSPGGAGPTSVLTAESAHILASDAESLAAIAAHRADTAESALLVHLRWRETLGRDALSRRFYRELERCVSALADSATPAGRVGASARRTLALLHVSRLLFLAFLEAKGWLDGDRNFLRRRFEASCGGRGAHHRLLRPLFFGTLNTPVSRRAPAARALGQVPFLNGGLFTHTPLERRHRDLRFGDDALGEVIGGLLGRYRLTAREASADWTDAAVDPEMLGRAFESLMASSERKSAGVFYTPHALIVRLTRAALATALPGTFAEHGAETSGAVRGVPPLTALDEVRLVDPACGSGAFLVHALEELADLRGRAGDRRTLSERRRHVLAHSIFGVDVDPTAAWLCQLRLWLSVVVDDDTPDPTRLLPLPNLDRNIRQGDSLAGAGLPVAPVPCSRDPLEALRLRYSRASGARKRTLGGALEAAERQRALRTLEREQSRIATARRELLIAARSPGLFEARGGLGTAQRVALLSLRDEARRLGAAARRLRDGGALPFSFETHFPDVAARGGFTVVLGNPPWVRPHHMGGTQRDREALRERFIVYRRAAWQAGADAAGAGRGFSSQADLAAIFTERAVQLAAPGAVIALLLPSKLWISLAGGGVRELLDTQAPVRSVEDWSDGTTGFDAAVYPSAVVAVRGASREAPAAVRVTVHQRGRSSTWSTARGMLALDATAGSPWLLLPPAARSAHARLCAAGVPLAGSPLGRPVLGVKSGCNEAFIVRRLGDGDGARVRSGDVEDVVDHALLRPVLRGEHLKPWHADAPAESIIWTHDAAGSSLAVLPRDTRRWLGRWRHRLEQRADGRGRARWWSLFRTDAARSDRPRVVWADIGRAPRAVVLASGDPAVPINSCYVIHTATPDDAHALAALLNSRVALAWLSALAEPARGGYRRFLGWTCARLPVPTDWDAARRTLAPLGRAALDGREPLEQELTAAVLAAYGLGREDVAPLLAWNADGR